ncbi:sodium-dependent transporter [Wenzhouxiangella sp. XN201]|uniref:sodium-dependent transporter n=1 Tax=Wenzhouxiangella sp. XN201 TaxID=2710755 RepID=UPI0013C7C211|nr:sodium-dependent transporter [Wenzhouxiangella sp. XN201]NEZ04931.1 sodium-dependent transporter [Wenzhouxiangella sp. XN201]
MSIINRGHWNSRLGFVLAASGSAIGLGNIWRFPYTAGTYGGGAWVLMYIFFVLAIGVPVLFAELSIGRASRASPVTAFKKLVPGTWWPMLGALGVLTGFGILSFYAIIAGLTVAYAFFALSGRFGGGLDIAQSGVIFTDLTANPVWMIGVTALFLLLTALVVRKGVGGGIERAATILMPILLIFLLVLVGRALTLPTAGEGLSFMFTPQFDQITFAGTVSALGQALFSLSLGMGAMITYGSYVSKDVNLPLSGFSIVICDLSIAILAGLVIFPAIFLVQAEPTAGPGLIFVVMGGIFDAMPASNLMAFVFYGLLSIAALTSTISLLEVIVAYFVDDRGWRREKAVWIVTGGCFALAIPSALSLGASEAFTQFGDGRGFLGWVDVLCGTYFLTIGAMLTSIFVGWKWGVPAALAAIEKGGYRLPAAPLWGSLLRYICPLAILILLIYGATQGANW